MNVVLTSRPSIARAFAGLSEAFAASLSTTTIRSLLRIVLHRAQAHGEGRGSFAIWNGARTTQGLRISDARNDFGRLRVC